MGQFQKLEGLIDTCRQMLEEQLANLSKGKMAELQQWQEASVEMRALLEQSFELVKEQGVSQADGARLKENLTDLVGLNNELFGATAKQRQIVADRLSGMRKGKSALSVYGKKQHAERPRFLSSSG